MSAWRVWDDEEDACLRKLKREGLSVKQIAAKLSRGPGSIRWRMRELGIAYPVGKGRSKAA